MFEHTTNECDEQKRLEAEAKDRAAVDKIVEGIQGRHTKLSEWLCDNHSNMAIHPIQMRPNWMSESTYFDNLVDDPAITVGKLCLFLDAMDRIVLVVTSEYGHCVLFDRYVDGLNVPTVCNLPKVVSDVLGGCVKTTLTKEIIQLLLGSKFEPAFIDKLSTHLPLKAKLPLYQHTLRR